MKYISLLRGINVSGQKTIKMADLKCLYEALEFENIVTYIQSGNVIFDSPEKNIIKLQDKVEREIFQKYQFHVPVEIRTNTEISKIINNCPFTNIDLTDNSTKVLVTFLSEKPSKTKIINLQKNVTPPEILTIKNKEVFLYCPNGYGKSKLNNNFLEKKLDVKATTRNWKTVQKLYDLSMS